MVRVGRYGFKSTPLSYAVLTGHVHEAFVKMKLKVMSSSDPTLKRACKHVAPKLRNGVSATSKPQARQTWLRPAIIPTHPRCRGRFPASPGAEASIPVVGDNKQRVFVRAFICQSPKEEVSKTKTLITMP